MPVQHGAWCSRQTTHHFLRGHVLLMGLPDPEGMGRWRNDGAAFRWLPLAFVVLPLYDVAGSVSGEILS